MATAPVPEAMGVNPDWAALPSQQFLVFLFESTIPTVRHRAGLFMGNHPNHGFAPQRIFKAWHDRFPKSIPHLHSTIIKPCMDEIALQESEKVMNDPRLKDAPYTWGFLSVFTTSPNEYRKKRARKGAKAKVATPVEPDEWEETPNRSSDDGAAFAGETGGFWKDMGFARNATFALVFVFSIMAFTRNTGTNVFPMILGLFLEIGGTSSRILNTLSNAGACVSITTIERLKKILGMSRLLGGVEVDVVLHSVGILGQCMRKDRHLGEHELANQDTCSLFNLHGVSVLFTLKLASIY
ncbi:hypothetical protein B0H14DRAFT_3697877 [Mycena olivaceomarginata]|nr:hypothetical protein B0H14DRAFT_3697877 [Mycena olivaceomarginata]